MDLLDLPVIAIRGRQKSLHVKRCRQRLHLPRRADCEECGAKSCDRRGRQRSRIDEDRSHLQRLRASDHTKQAGVEAGIRQHERGDRGGVDLAGQHGADGIALVALELDFAEERCRFLRADLRKHQTRDHVPGGRRGIRECHALASQILEPLDAAGGERDEHARVGRQIAIDTFDERHPAVPFLRLDEIDRIPEDDV